MCRAIEGGCHLFDGVLGKGRFWGLLERHVEMAGLPGVASPTTFMSLVEVLNTEIAPCAQLDGERDLAADWAGSAVTGGRRGCAMIMKAVK